MAFVFISKKRGSFYNFTVLYVPHRSLPSHERASFEVFACVLVVLVPHPIQFTYQTHVMQRHATTKEKHAKSTPPPYRCFLSFAQACRNTSHEACRELHFFRNEHTRISAGFTDGVTFLRICNVCGSTMAL